MNANEREWSRIKAKVFLCCMSQAYNTNICGYLRSLALFAFSFNFFNKIILILALLNSIQFPAQATTNSIDPKLRQRLIAAINHSSSFDDRFHAEVWLLDMSTRLKIRVEDTQTRLRLLRSIHREASRVELPPELIIALIDIESRFDHFAISRSGAQGLMQIMPFWLKEIGHPEDNLMDIDTNLRMGCTILKYYMDIERGNIRRALARYNGSLGSWKYPDKVMSVLSKYWYKN
ncbi:FIG016425: Soluble lytic murein transglycosylase and related regulatory proteins (some contain LysM/invasin domains) [hydrothermal vent metagenome]|uniref:FIG016425: Soluble lytic murein transglycosylase and related regulatory proteins (Some contain LysM/invasin domains) n=1 Tax=hydrothermal vent metagenome TaxID=652676 RepID=A0A3B0X068_9ZZZZ